MSLFNIFENLKITGKFWKKIAPYISGYMLVFIFALLGVWIAYGVDKNLMAGFTLFNFFPGWLRFVCLDLVASALMAIPLGIIGGFFISWDNEIHYPAYIHSLIHDFDLKCIECSNGIEPPEDTWVSIQSDIECEKCGALMTITIVEGQLKKMILKEHGRYHY